MTVSVWVDDGDDRGMSSPLSSMIGHPYARHPSTGYTAAASGRRTRRTGWDVICTIALWVVLVLAAGTAMWLSLFFGFATDTCPTAGCPPVPLGIDELIYPVTWGGIGVAFRFGSTSTSKQ